MAYMQFSTPVAQPGMYGQPASLSPIRLRRFLPRSEHRFEDEWQLFSARVTLVLPLALDKTQAAWLKYMAHRHGACDALLHLALA